MIKMVIAQNEHGLFSFCVEDEGMSTFGTRKDEDEAVRAACEIVRHHALNGSIWDEKVPHRRIKAEAEILRDANKSGGHNTPDDSFYGESAGDKQKRWMKACGFLARSAGLAVIAFDATAQEIVKEEEAAAERVAEQRSQPEEEK